jgi:peptidylamidoglycolate lyase
MPRANMLHTGLIGAATIAAAVLLVSCGPGTTIGETEAPGTAMEGTEAQSSVTFEKGGSEETGPYDAVPDWPKPIHPDWTWGRTGGVWAESPDRIYIIQTGEIPVATRNAGGNPPRMHAVDHPDTRTSEHRFLVVDGEGNLIESWEQANPLFVHPHSVKQSPYDPEKHVWVVDGRSRSGEAAHQIWKFNHDGEVVMTLGEHKVEGNDESHFGGPTDLAFLPNGDFLVADGYRNSRIVRFDQDGNYLSQFGEPGSGPGQFRTIHGVAVDAEGRIYTADRSNSRIQVFDQEGNLLDIWPNIPMPMDIAVTEDGSVWVADGQVNKFLKFNRDGRLLYAWGTFGQVAPGRVWGTHRISVDSDGNFYTADVWGGRAQKFTPKPNADPTRLVGTFLDF